ncbi:MAG: hypothetical protein MUC96_10765 [Myxococcaceae bacterium]|nr:hypothetical protein [Myxococcaceae bacterium]
MLQAPVVAEVPGEVVLVDLGVSGVVGRVTAGLWGRWLTRGMTLVVAQPGP